MGPTWGRQDPDGPHVGPMNFTIWDSIIWVVIAHPCLICLTALEGWVWINNHISEFHVDVINHPYSKPKVGVANLCL